MAKSTNDKPLSLLTIPAIARTGLLPESTLRAMDRANQLPCIKIKHRTYVNYNKLIEMLDNLQGGGLKDE